MAPKAKAAPRRRATPDRGYSRNYPIPPGQTGRRYLLDAIPPALWAKVKAKATREGRSIRSIALDAFTAYATGGPR